LTRRQEWFDAQLNLDPAKLVFIDGPKDGLSTQMSRLRGRSLRGERCRSAVPHGHWKTTTFTGALRLCGMTAPMVLDGPMNGWTFRAYVEQVLVEDGWPDFTPPLRRDYAPLPWPTFAPPLLPHTACGSNDQSPRPPSVVGISLLSRRGPDQRRGPFPDFEFRRAGGSGRVPPSPGR
jgi:hypothetical protein